MPRVVYDWWQVPQDQQTARDPSTRAWIARGVQTLEGSDEAGQTTDQARRRIELEPFYHGTVEVEKLIGPGLGKAGAYLHREGSVVRVSLFGA